MAQQCQFDETCSTGSSHYRKVISHIFGRNKKCTVNIPDSVWIYYCRKHYQRARYRNDEWPFTQCRLAIDTICNMRAWGGVESFDLTLRRRERQPQADHQAGHADDQESQAALAASSSSPPPPPSSAAGFASVNPNSGGPGQVKLEDVSDDEHGSEAVDDSARAPASDPQPSTSTSTSTAARTSKKRSPKSIPRPVPDWLHSCVGTRKSFDEILQVLNDLRAYFLSLTANNEEAFFPDIEILPNLRRQLPSKPHQQLQQQSSSSTSSSSRKGPAGSRVSNRGAVTKVEKK